MGRATDDITKARKKRAETTGTPVLVRMDKDELQILDDWRRQESDVPGRPESLRRLMRLGIAFDLERKFAVKSAPKPKH